MQENLSVTVSMNASGAAILMSVAAQLTGAAPVAAPAATDAPPKGKPGRKSNAEKAAMAAAQQGATAADDGLGLGGDDDAGDELGLDDTPPPAVKLTLEGDIVPAFRKFIEAAKGDKAKAGAVLASFGVKSVRDLKEDQYSAVLAKLKV